MREHDDGMRSGLAARVELAVAQPHERQADVRRQPRLPPADLRQPVIPLHVADAPVPRRLVEQAVSLGRSFMQDPVTDAVMMHGDLHYQNVLAGDREPWLVIDPKPMAGDRHYEPAPMLWNRWDEAVASGNLRFALRRRFHTLVDVAGLDEDRARDWVVVRMIHNASWDVIDGDPDEDRLTRWFTIAKAVQD